MMESNDKIYITPSDLKPGEVKVVVYIHDGATLIVPDPHWNMIGDLSKLPDETRKFISSPKENKITVRQAIIHNGSQTVLIPSGTKVLSDITANGFSMCDKIEIKMVEQDSQGNPIG